MAERLSTIQRDTESRRMKSEADSSAETSDSDTGTISSLWKSVFGSSKPLARWGEIFDPRKAPPALRESQASKDSTEEGSTQLLDPSLRCIELKAEAWRRMHFVDRLLCVAAYYITRAVGKRGKRRLFAVPCNSSQQLGLKKKSRTACCESQGKMPSTVSQMNELATCFNAKSLRSTWEDKPSTHAHRHGEEGFSDVDFRRNVTSSAVLPAQV